MTVTLNLKPEVEAGLLAEAQAAGVTLEDYLQYLVEKELFAKGINQRPSEGSGMVWENGLFVYRTGRPLPTHIVDDAIRRSREERARHILGDVS
jgi:hypothetical protein